jgi:AAA15 family ATPase/GTPase
MRIDSSLTYHLLRFKIHNEYIMEMPSPIKKAIDLTFLLELNQESIIGKKSKVSPHNAVIIHPIKRKSQNHRTRGDTCNLKDL